MILWMISMIRLIAVKKSCQPRKIIVLGYQLEIYIECRSSLVDTIRYRYDILASHRYISPLLSTYSFQGRVPLPLPLPLPQLSPSHSPLSSLKEILHISSLLFGYPSKIYNEKQKQKKKRTHGTTNYNRQTYTIIHTYGYTLLYTEME